MAFRQDRGLLVILTKDDVGVNACLVMYYYIFPISTLYILLEQFLQSYIAMIWSYQMVPGLVHPYIIPNLPTMELCTPY